jgi:large subunit ribosomal protein L18e
MRSSNPEISSTIRLLRKKTNETGGALWVALAKKIEKSKHASVSVNLSRINRYTRENEKVVVPGKVLSSGSLEHKILIAAVSFSKEARRKIEEIGGECLTIPLLVEKYPKGSEIKIIE